MILNKITNKFRLKHSVNVPSSKSLCNRLLVLRFLQGNSFDILGISEADDSQLLQEIFDKGTLSGELHVKNAGTCFRFLTAVCSIGNGEVVLTGSEEMKKRPIRELVEPLRSLGADIHYLDSEGFPPLQIKGKPLKGGKVKVNAEISSQYVSALLLIAPFLEKGLEIEQIGNPKSASYTQMTISLLRNMGVTVTTHANVVKVEPLSRYFSSHTEVEADWSSASYWYELIAFSPIHSKLQINKVKSNSIQGDREVVDLFKNLGVTTLEGSNGVEIVKTTEVKIARLEHDFSSIPDLVPTIVVTCVGLGIDGVFRGISHLIYKETDRISALKNEVDKLNYNLVMLDEDSFLLEKRTGLPRKVSISTYHDHRMAMAFAPLSVLMDEIEIENPEVVAKSYPRFWDEFC